MYVEFKKEVCPICGHKDNCARIVSEPGKDLIVCKRTKDISKRVQGKDGLIYAYAFTSKSDGNLIFEEENQREKNRQAYLESKGFKYGKSKDKGDAVMMDNTPRVVEEDIVMPLSSDVCDKVYRSILSKLSLDDGDREYLLSEGWTEKLISEYNIVSMPISDKGRRYQKWGYQTKNRYRGVICDEVASEFGGSLCGIPGCYMDTLPDGTKHWFFNCPSGLLIPVPDQQKRWYRLRVRKNYLDEIRAKKNGVYLSSKEGVFVQPYKGLYKIEDGKKVFLKGGGKYRNFSSNIEEDEIINGVRHIRNKLKGGCKSGNAIGCYWHEDDDFYCATVTEGEKKAIIANEMMHQPIICVPGVESFNLILSQGILNALRERGTKIIIVAFDADAARNEAVFKCQEMTVKMLQNHGFFVAVAYWPEEKGKGLDDLLVNGYKPEYVCRS